MPGSIGPYGEMMRHVGLEHDLADALRPVSALDREAAVLEVDVCLTRLDSGAAIFLPLAMIFSAALTIARRPPTAIEREP